MAKIKKLNPTLIALIAAGEVIQSPRDILKELLENSCDADATEITVNLLQGGIERISVLDNGHGIDPDDLELAITPHATSKISEINHLSSISSYGFRGEALYTIAVVTNFTLKSRTINNESGTMLRSFLNQKPQLQSCAMKIGTEIICEQLFAPTPVRRKFLKSPRLESKRSENMVKNILLLKNDISIKLISNGQLIFQINTAKSLIERIANFFKIPTDLIQFKNLIIDIGFINCWFYPLHTKGLEQYWYVNERWVSDPIFIRLGQQYFQQGILILQIVIDQDYTDVNVHPQKHIVNISKSESLIASLTEIFIEFNPDLLSEKEEKEEVQMIDTQVHDHNHNFNLVSSLAYHEGIKPSYGPQKLQERVKIFPKNINTNILHIEKDQFFFLGDELILVSNKNSQLLFNGFEFIRTIIELGLEPLSPLLLPIDIKHEQDLIFFEKLNIKLINNKLSIFFPELGIYNLRNYLDSQNLLTLKNIFTISWWQRYTFEQIKVIADQSNLFVKTISTTNLINFFLKYE